MYVDFSSINQTDRYKIVSNIVVPRVIAWIVTISDKNILNVAPFSYFTPLSSEPPTLIVSIGHKKDGSQKDTLRNILTTKKATICFINEKLLKSMHDSSFPFENSEIDELNLITETILNNYPPIIKGVKNSLFTDFYQVIELENSKTIPIILKIKGSLINDDVNNKIIGRVGNGYSIIDKDRIIKFEN